jgi:hypothetical protein
MGFVLFAIEGTLLIVPTVLKAIVSVLGTVFKGGR